MHITLARSPSGYSDSFVIFSPLRVLLWISSPKAESQPSDRIGRWRARVTAENPSLQLIYLLLIPTCLDSRRRRTLLFVALLACLAPPPPPPWYVSLLPAPPNRTAAQLAPLLLTVAFVLAGPEEGQGPAAVVQAGQVRRREAEEEEVEQGEAEGEGQQRGALRPGHLRQAALRGAQVQADHPVRPLRAPQGNIT
jgi:hypothetical protein